MTVWVSDSEISDQSAINAIRSRQIVSLIFTIATRESQALPAVLDAGELQRHAGNEVVDPHRFECPQCASRKLSPRRWTL